MWKQHLKEGLFTESSQNTTYTPNTQASQLISPEKTNSIDQNSWQDQLSQWLGEHIIPLAQGCKVLGKALASAQKTMDKESLSKNLSKIIQKIHNIQKYGGAQGYH